MYEIHDWLTQDLHLVICEREVANLIVDFLALLSAAQPAKIRDKLGCLHGLVISVDGMQPEKGNDCLYIVREIQCGVTLLAVNLEESSQEALCEQLFEPLKAWAQELGLPWHGVVSDAQETIRLAVAQSLQGVPHQACQSHCLRDAGKLTFEADRTQSFVSPGITSPAQTYPDFTSRRPVSTGSAGLHRCRSFGSARRRGSPF
jgi:hypothetical protein